MAVLRRGAAVSVATAPGLGVPTSAVAGTQGVSDSGSGVEGCGAVAVGALSGRGRHGCRKHLGRQVGSRRTCLTGRN